MDKIKVSAIIVTKDRNNDLKETILSLINQEGIYTNFDIEFFIVDNSIEKNFVLNTKLLKELKLNKDDINITIIRPTKNIGAGPGYFLAHQYIKSDFTLKSDDDVIYKSDYIKTLIKYMKKDKSIGAISGLVYYNSFPNKIWYSGGKFIKPIVYTKPLSKREIIKKDFIVLDDLVSCAMLIRNQYLKNVGGFDKDFFVYKDDTSLCYRLSKNGYKLLLITDSYVFHKVPYPKRITPFSVYFDTYNRFIFSKKYHSFNEKLLFIPYMILFYLPIKTTLSLKLPEKKNIIKNLFKSCFQGLGCLFNNQNHKNINDFEHKIIKL